MEAIVRWIGEGDGEPGKVPFKRTLATLWRQTKLLETPKMSDPPLEACHPRAGCVKSRKKHSQLCTTAHGVLTQGHGMTGSIWACCLAWLSTHSLPTPASSSCLAKWTSPPVSFSWLSEPKQRAKNHSLQRQNSPASVHSNIFILSTQHSVSTCRFSRMISPKPAAPQSPMIFHPAHRADLEILLQLSIEAKTVCWVYGCQPRPLPGFANKVLWRHSHCFSWMFCLRLCVHCSGHVE